MNERKELNVFYIEVPGEDGEKQLERVYREFDADKAEKYPIIEEAYVEGYKRALHFNSGDLHLGGDCFCCDCDDDALDFEEFFICKAGRMKSKEKSTWFQLQEDGYNLKRFNEWGRKGYETGMKHLEEIKNFK